MTSKTLKLLFACTPLPVLQHANLAPKYELSFVQPIRDQHRRRIMLKETST
jgi:hypothetical protein